MAIPELRPPEVTTSPASTQRTQASPAPAPSTRSARSSTSSQCVVHGRLPSSPSDPRMNAPVHTDATTGVSAGRTARPRHQPRVGNHSSIAIAPGTTAHRAPARSASVDAGVSRSPP